MTVTDADTMRAAIKKAAECIDEINALKERFKIVCESLKDSSTDVHYIRSDTEYLISRIHTLATFYYQLLDTFQTLAEIYVLKT